MSGKDMLLLPDGSTYHLGAKKGEVYSRILTVGSFKRAKAIATQFDEAEKIMCSDRGFHIYNGKINGVGISIIAIGMGSPMMDFMIREASFVDEGPMACIRLGTCGILNKELAPGTVCTAGNGSSYIYQNFAAYTGAMNDDTINEKSTKFIITKPEQCTTELNELMIAELKAAGVPTHDGINAAGEFFYSTQGRANSHFDDCNNADIVDCLTQNGVDSLEMETHMLFHLGKHRTVAPLATAGAAIGILNRTNPELPNIGGDQLHELEKQAGKACLLALAAYKL